MKDIRGFVRERDIAFIEFVQTGKTDKVRRYCRKYGIAIPKERKIRAAGIYKAVIATTSIPEDIKLLAMQKCLEMGFSPLIGPPERSES